MHMFLHLYGIIEFKFIKDLYFIDLKVSNYKRISFPGGSDGKTSACNVGDWGSFPGLGRSPGKGKDYSIQYSWASLVAQLVKNSPTVLETWVRSLGWEDPLEKGKATHCSILA